MATSPDGRVRPYLGLMTQKRVRTSQPQGAVGVDWGNPLTAGLKALGTPSVLAETLSGSSAVISGGFYLAATDRGIAAVGPTTQIPGYVQYLCENSAVNYSGGCTYLAFARSSVVNTTVPTHRVYATGSFLGAEFIFGTAHISAAVDGNTAGSTTAYDVTVPRVAVVQRRPSTNAGRLYVDGAFISSSVTGTRSGTLTSLVIGRDLVSNNVVGTTTYLVAAWNRALSDIEIERVSANPWQLFAPRNIPSPSALSFTPERQVFTPARSRMLGASTGTVPTVAIQTTKKTAWTSQPQGVVEVDWSNPDTLSLAGAWPLQDGQFRDATGRYNGTLNAGVTPSVSALGRTLTFNGSSGVVTLVAPTSGLALKNINHSISLWLYPTALTGLRVIFHQWDYTHGPILYTNGTDLSWQVGTSPAKITATGGIELDKWQHFVVTYAPSSLVIYKNGVLLQSGTPVTENASIVNIAVQFGGDSSLGWYTAGQMAAPAVWTRTLSADEARRQYEATWELYAPRRSMIWVPYDV